MTKLTSKTRESYVALFGEEQARAIERAAEMHANGINSENKGTDEFRWAFLITIGYKCFTSFREGHGITVPVDRIKEWAKSQNLGEHDGDVDYLSLFCGIYNEYVE